MKIGHGYDVHKLVKKRKLILGGERIPYKKGLKGHSDADVLVHAIIDALLGAANLGDIGCLFPDDDNAYKNAHSLDLLSIVCDNVKNSGLSISNIDSTIIAEKPVLKEYIPVMRKNIAQACNIEIGKVSVKATTEEGLGFSGKGIAAHAVCLLDI